MNIVIYVVSGLKTTISETRTAYRLTTFLKSVAFPTTFFCRHMPYTAKVVVELARGVANFVFAPVQTSFSLTTLARRLSAVPIGRVWLDIDN